MSVQDFLEKLASQVPQSPGEERRKNRSLEKIYLNFEGNLGRYQILPFGSVFSEYPFEKLWDTKEIVVPRRNIASDGTENVYTPWIKILPKSAYRMKDPGTGRIVSSLTAAEEELLEQASMLHDQLCAELDVKNNSKVPYINGFVRKKNYTVFHAHCLNFWNRGGDGRTPTRQNFSALFAVTSKNFIKAIQDNIEEKAMMSNGSYEWISQIYNRETKDRTGFLLFSVQPNTTTAGFACTATHEYGRALTGIEIPEEAVELMADPIESFLGWQASREDPSVAPEYRRLFNEGLIRETIAFMSQQLAAIRMAKTNGGSIEEAIKSTSKKSLEGKQPTTTMGREINDPSLIKGSTAGGFNTAAVHLDPITGSASSTTQTQAQPQSAPQFGFGGGWAQGVQGTQNTPSNGGGDDLPF